VYQTTFQKIKVSAEGGQLGKYCYVGGQIETPSLFPVIFLITGVPGLERNGASWKIIKKEFFQKRRMSHFLTHAMHFVDYSISPACLARWREKTIKGWLDEWLNDEDYYPCMFADSGGFKLLYNQGFDLDRFDFDATAEDIFHLQMDYGADMVISLDYPLPPNLIYEEALKRMDMSIKNGLKLLTMLQEGKYCDKVQKSPLAFIAVHGQDYTMIKNYTLKLMSSIDESEIEFRHIGFAIGSLVPMRSDYRHIIDMMKGVAGAIREYEDPKYFDAPIHVLGVSGDLMPVLSYLGVDSFDCSTYVQYAGNLNYMNPVTWQSKKFYELEELSCDCQICREWSKYDINRVKEILASPPGKYYDLAGETIIKSAIYAFIAIHNWEIYEKEARLIRESIEADALIEHLIEFAEGHPRTKKVLSYLADIDAKVGQRLGRTQFLFEPSTLYQPRRRRRSISLEYTPAHFKFPEDDKIPAEKEILLLIPCSSEKPYSASRSHKTVMKTLENDSRIDKVTVSGMYGPVPQKYENRKEILSYDYMLTSNNKKRKQLIVERLSKLLQIYGHHYKEIIGYATTKAYREVIEKAIKQYGRGIVLPSQLAYRRTRELYKKNNLEELRNVVWACFESAEDPDRI